MGGHRAAGTFDTMMMKCQGSLRLQGPDLAWMQLATHTEWAACDTWEVFVCSNRKTCKKIGVKAHASASGAGIAYMTSCVRAGLDPSGCPSRRPSMLCLHQDL